MDHGNLIYVLLNTPVENTWFNRPIYQFPMEKHVLTDPSINFPWKTHDLIYFLLTNTWFNVLWSISYGKNTWFNRPIHFCTWKTCDLTYPSVKWQFHLLNASKEQQEPMEIKQHTCTGANLGCFNSSDGPHGSHSLHFRVVQSSRVRLCISHPAR